MRACLVGIVMILVFAAAVASPGSVPPIINYQGKLMQPSGVPVADGSYSIQFAIYDTPTGGTALWSETNPNVQVKGGLFSVLLGSVVNLPGNIFDGPNRFFGVKVASDPEMTPRQEIASVGFAFKAAVAQGVETGAITTQMLADGAVTGTKIAGGAITSDKLATGTLGDIGHAQITSNSAPLTTAIEDIAGLSVTVTVPAGGRKVKITACTNVDYPSAPGYTDAVVYIYEGTTQLQWSTQEIVAFHPKTLITQVVLTPTAGSHTYRVRARSATYTYGTVVLASPDAPAFILVEVM